MASSKSGLKDYCRRCVRELAIVYLKTITAVTNLGGGPSLNQKVWIIIDYAACCIIKLMEYTVTECTPEYYMNGQLSNTKLTIHKIKLILWCVGSSIVCKDNSHLYEQLLSVISVSAKHILSLGTFPFKEIDCRNSMCTLCIYVIVYTVDIIITTSCFNQSFCVQKYYCPSIALHDLLRTLKLLHVLVLLYTTNYL